MGFKLSKSFGWTLARDSNPGGGAPRGYSYLIDKNGVVMLDARGNALLMRVRNG